MKRFLSPLLIGLLAIGLVACSKEAPDTKAAKAPAAASGATVGLAISTLNNPFFVTLRQGAEDAAKAQGSR